METVEFTTPRKAKIFHDCTMCQRNIRPKEVYFRTFLHDGEAYAVFKECMHCRRSLDAYIDAHPDEELMTYTGVVDWLKENFPLLYAAWGSNWAISGHLLPHPFSLGEDDEDC